MKTIAKLMALCLLMGSLGFAQTGGDKKADDSTKKSDSADKGKGKKHKDKAKGKKGADDKKAAADDKGGDKK